MAGRSINVNLLAAFSGDGFIKAQNQLKSLGDSAQGMAGKAVKAAATFAVAWTSRAIKDFGLSAIEQASNLQRSMLALDTVFGRLSPRIEAFTKSAGEFGMSQAEAAKASTFLGSVLKQSGFSMASTAKETENLVRLAADLSTTYGYDVQEALMGMTALFRGEYDPIEKFGVAMKQSEINAELAARGMDKLEGSQRRLAEQQIRLELLYERSSDAQGAFARGSGTLYVEQERLEAAFNNMLQTVGTPLLTAFADLASAMTPIIEELTPTMVEMFSGLVPTAETLNAESGKLKDTILKLAQGFSDLIGFLTTVITWYIQNYDWVNKLAIAGGIWLGVVKGIGFAMQVMAVQAGTAAAANATLNATLVANPYFVVAAAVAGLIAVISLLSLEVAKYAEGTTDEFEGVRKEIMANEDAFTTMATNGSSAYRGILGEAVNYNGVVTQSRATTEALATAANGSDVSLQRLASSLENAKIKAEFFANSVQYTNRELARMSYYASGMQIPAPKIEEDPDPTGGGTVKDWVKDFYKNLRDEAAKESARIKLDNLGLSDALIEKILGSGEGWKKIFNEIVKGGQAAADEVQKLFNKTGEGLAELQKLAEQRAEAEKKFQEQITGNIMALYERLREKYEENQRMITELKGSVSELFSTFKEANQATESMGALEQSIANLASGLRQLIAEQPTSLIPEKAQKKLQNYLDLASSQMQAVAKQRDELEARIGNAKSLMQTVIDSIMGSVNITQFKGSSESIIKQLKKQVEAQANFQANIQRLRESGLSGTALKQIQEAGVQAGGATATALLKGGQTAIDEVNALYAQLGQVATTAGENEASAMYGAGIDMADGLMAGLEARQAQLTAMAEAMAAQFEKTFNKALGQGIRQMSEPNQAAWTAYSQQLATAMAQANASLAPGQGYQYNGLTGGYVNGIYLPPQPQGGTTGGNITINLNAGLGVNGADVGRQIVDEIKKYERRNGSVFVPAVM